MNFIADRFLLLASIPKARFLYSVENETPAFDAAVKNHQFDQSSSVIKLANSDRSLFASVTWPTIPFPFMRSTR